MTRKKWKLCWDDVADIDSRWMASWQAFSPNLCETLEIEGEGIDQPATFMMDDDGKGFDLVYVWCGSGYGTGAHRVHILLDEIPRGLGKEIVFLCPGCGRRCIRLALRPPVPVCAKCGPVTWGSNREGKVARMVRRANAIAAELGLTSWTEKPLTKPAHMRLARYVRLLEQRERVVLKIAMQLRSRRRIVGNNIMHMCDAVSAMSATDTGGEMP